MDTSFLSEIGLTPGEIKTYIALLKIGTSSTGPLAHESQVSRSKLYDILDKLEKKGMASHVEQNGVACYQAVEPAKIKTYLLEKEKQIKDMKIKLESYIPQLEKLQKTGKVQSVNVYQGFKGLITVHEHTYLKLKKGEEYLYLGIPRYQPEAHHLYWQRDHKRRIKTGIKCRMLFNQDTPLEVLKNRNSYKGCSSRYMPFGIKTPSYMLIYRDTTVIVVPSESPLCIEIISQEITDSYKAYFEEFWKIAKNDP
ncbi:hypothetical protein J4422_03970 [Candidatus Pacearchaeota archaeon]|nr:hypothetical protein [Candidatus Pacearchaeota archaeon]